MARELRNVSGEARSLQGVDGVWHVVEPDGIYTVESSDARYFQTGEFGEEPVWADVTKSKPTKAAADKGSE